MTIKHDTGKEEIQLVEAIQDYVSLNGKSKLTELIESNLYKTSKNYKQEIKQYRALEEAHDLKIKEGK